MTELIHSRHAHRKVSFRAKRMAALASRVPDHSVIVTPSVARELFTDSRVKILEALQKEGSFGTLNKLAEEIGLKPSNVSRDIRPLVQHGLVVKESEGRRSTISLSDKVLVVGY